MAGTAMTPQRFWAKVGRKDKNGCRKWRRGLTEHGYGYVIFDGWRTTAHRVAYYLAFGEFDYELVIMHKCDVRSCCNPEHLMLGTQADNIADMREKRRGYTFVPRFGEEHHRTKLTTAQVAEIKRLYATTRLSQQAIAARFNVGQSQVGRIIRGEGRAQG